MSDTPSSHQMTFLREKAPRTHEIVEAAFARSPEEGKSSLRAAIWSILLVQIQFLPKDPHFHPFVKQQLLSMIADIMSLYETNEWLDTTFAPVSNLFADDIQGAINTPRASRGY